MKSTKKKWPSADLFTPVCKECNKYLQPTETGYLVCPEGHGKLVPYEARFPEEADLFQKGE